MPDPLHQHDDLARCEECGSGVLRPVVLATWTRPMKYDGRRVEVTAHDLPAFQCDHCSAVALPDESMGRMLDALRRQEGVLSPDEIRAARERQGLSQRDFALELGGIAPETISRWETGAILPSRMYNDRLREFLAKRSSARCLLTPESFFAGVVAHSSELHGAWSRSGALPASFFGQTSWINVQPQRADPSAKNYCVAA